MDEPCDVMTKLAESDEPLPLHHQQNGRMTFLSAKIKKSSCHIHHKMQDTDIIQIGVKESLKLPFTKKTLIGWAGHQVLKDAEALIKREQVFSAEYNPPSVSGIILWNNRKLNTSFNILSDGNIESLCPCYTNKERGMICVHAIALALTLIHRSTDPLREAKYKEELRRAERVDAFDESAYIKRVQPNSPGAISASIILIIDNNWLKSCAIGKIDISCFAEYNSKIVPLNEIPADLPLSFAKEDEAILFVIEDISEGPAKGRLTLNLADFCNIVRLYAGKQLACVDSTIIEVNDARLSTYVQMDLDRENGELILIAHTEMPYLSPGTFPDYIIAGKTGFAYGNGNLWPLENILPTPYHSIYKAPVIIAREGVLQFVQQELPLLAKHARIESNISPELFTIEPAAPRFTITINGSPASLSAVLHASYGDIKLIAGKSDAKENFGLPDINDILRYTTRNLPAEQTALTRLHPSGLIGEYGDRLSSIVSKRDVLNFLATWVPTLRRKGWRVDLHGKIEPLMESLPFATPVVHVHESSDERWFDIGFDFEDDQGGSISPADVQMAIIKGDSYIQRGNQTVLIDSNAVESMQNVFSDCASGDGNKAGQFRMSSVYAPFVKSSLEALDGIDIETNNKWRDTASKYNRSAKLEAIPLGEPLDGILRDYQKDGVNWLAFLESQGFCGILADEMGLGKTIQTLAWLKYNKETAKSPRAPVLVVCPTSLVENWADEAQRFVPNMKVVTFSGSNREEKWKNIDKYDLAVTSYAILRRDLDLCLEHEFSVAILDEAQHIKNKSTQNALAAKKIRARHRLVLTGTPVENSVSDLWSIMDFLMPGYLGPHSLFRQNYHLPISKGDQEGEMAQAKLRRKLHPFLLRRLKSNVAKDLPSKIEKISSCALSSDQSVVYKELVKASRTKINDMVKKKGFNKCRMEILTTLLRLRQVCCHLDLLKLPDLKAKHPSSKMELLFELLDEAIDGGHRVLIFSQFVSMLKILQKEIESRNLEYCYLDGSTKDRLSIVKRFNADKNIPIFLISLKAGGTGLNLTGADMVIHFDPWWNPAVEDQATDRAHRIGQSRTVYSIKMITKGTVEEKVLALQKKKKAVINATLQSDEATMQSMSWEDIQEILTI